MCERFTYYGYRATLATYLSENLDLSDKAVTAITSSYNLFMYIMPLIGGYISDTIWGRYKTIINFSLMYLFGTIVLTLSTLETFSITLRYVLLGLGLIFTSVGTGGIKPCISVFGADQQYIDEETKMNNITDTNLSKKLEYNDTDDSNHIKYIEPTNQYIHTASTTPTANNNNNSTLYNQHEHSYSNIKERISNRIEYNQAIEPLLLPLNNTSSNNYSDKSNIVLKNEESIELRSRKIDQSVISQKYMYRFYFMLNIGGQFGGQVMPSLQQYMSHFSAFLMASILQFISIIILWIGKWHKLFRLVPPSKSELSNIYGIIREAYFKKKNKNGYIDLSASTVTTSNTVVSNYKREITQQQQQRKQEGEEEEELQQRNTEIESKNTDDFDKTPKFFLGQSKAYPKYSKEAINNVRHQISTIPFLSILPIYWTISNQQGSQWETQTGLLQNKVGKLVIPNGWVQSINPIVLFCIQSPQQTLQRRYAERFKLKLQKDHAMYTATTADTTATTTATTATTSDDKCKDKRNNKKKKSLKESKKSIQIFSILVKILLGMLICILAQLSCIAQQIAISKYKYKEISIFFQFPQFILLAFSESFIAVSSLEYVNMKVPQEMKSMLVSLYYLTSSFGDIITLIVTVITQLLNTTTLSIYVVLLVLMIFNIIYYQSIRHRYTFLFV